MIKKLAVLLFCGGFVLFAGSPLCCADNGDLSDPSVQKAVLVLAREAFDAYSRTHTVIDPPSQLSPVLSRRCAVFISTMTHGAPRTCMGTLYPCQANFAEEIIQNAVASAGRDRRFPPVRPDELRSLDLIVSVIIGTPRPISATEALDLDPVHSGLAVLFHDRYGVVLSGETANPANLVKWGRIRAGAKANDPVSYFEIQDIRFMESDFK